MKHEDGYRWQRAARCWVATVALLLIGAGSLHAGLTPYQAPLALPAAEFAPSSSAGGANLALDGPGSVPVALRIAAIGVSVSLSELGLNPDGTVAVPTNFAEPGWFRLGPSPGRLGSAVILGHVDSYQGPAVFYRLRFLHRGDQVEVSLADGVVARFVVETVATYPKDEFPANDVYGSHGYPALQLVTCGGEFDYRTRSYVSNVVVYTSLVSTTAASSPSG